MRTRFLSLAGAGLAVTFVAAGLLLEMPGQPHGPPPLAFPALEARIASADRIEVAHAGQVIWLERRGQVWGLAQQGGYPAPPGQVEALLRTLQTLRLTKPAATAPAMEDPFKPVENSGVYLRVLGLSGAALCAFVVPVAPGSVLRRPGDPETWEVSAPLHVPATAAGWSQHALPPLDPAEIQGVDGGHGLDPAAVAQALSGLRFTDVRPAPQHRLRPVRTVTLALLTGTAVLTVGEDGPQRWLYVSGTAPWAARLAPYAFALPGDSPLAAF